MRASPRRYNGVFASNTPEYRAWKHMKERCLNPAAQDYAYYGGRGVKLYQAWHDFDSFYKDMGPRPSYHHTLDRRDVDGDYEPSNCRWVTRDIQAQNQRKRVNKTGYSGVCYKPSADRFTSRIHFNDEVVHLGTFKNAEVAAIAYDCAVIQLHGCYTKLNFLGKEAGEAEEDYNDGFDMESYADMVEAKEVDEYQQEQDGSNLL